ncbi:MAG: ORF6N domain-containing protein [Bacteroidales bacterium]|nr:ORF6N domain-containing protein [Bacteroidales bacterium]
MKDNPILKTRYFKIRGSELIIDLDVASIFEVDVEEDRKVVTEYPLKFKEGYGITLTEKETEDICTEWGKKAEDVPDQEKPLIAFNNFGVYMIGCLLHTEFSAYWSQKMVRLYAKFQALSHLLSKVFENPDMNPDLKTLHLEQVNFLLSEILEETTLSKYGTDVSVMNIRKVCGGADLESSGVTAEA